MPPRTVARMNPDAHRTPFDARFGRRAVAPLISSSGGVPSAAPSAAPSASPSISPAPLAPAVPVLAVPGPAPGPAVPPPGAVLPPAFAALGGLGPARPIEAGDVCLICYDDENLIRCEGRNNGVPCGFITCAPCLEKCKKEMKGEVCTYEMCSKYVEDLTRPDSESESSDAEGDAELLAAWLEDAEGEFDEDEEWDEEWDAGEEGELEEEGVFSDADGALSEEEDAVSTEVVGEEEVGEGEVVAVHFLPDSEGEGEEVSVHFLPDSEED